jgi:hypothetical protein
MTTLWQKTCDQGHLCHSYPLGRATTLPLMLLIACPVTGADVLVSADRIRSVTNHPTHIAVTVACCSCGQTHVHRTGRRWAAAEAAAARRAEELVPA